MLVCTFEHPDIGDAPPDVHINVGGQGPWVARAAIALGGHRNPTDAALLIAPEFQAEIAHAVTAALVQFLA